MKAKPGKPDIVVQQDGTTAMDKPKTHRAPSNAPAVRESFTLGAAGLIVKGNPTYEEWSAYFGKLTNMGNSVAWALGDMLMYAEGRQDWAEIWAQAIDETQKSVDSLQSFRNLAKKFLLDRRRPILSWSHHREVVRLPESEQDEWLDICEREGLSVKQLRERMRKEDAGDVLPFNNPTSGDTIYVVMSAGKPESAWSSKGAADRHVEMLLEQGVRKVPVIFDLELQDGADQEGDDTEAGGF